MAAITITTNISAVFDKIKSNFDMLKDKEYLLRPLAIETIPNMKDRIHKDGAATDGAQIGTYSNGYMRKREENNRGEDRKIIVSLTRQLENDWAVLGTSTGYGIGFNNPLNKQKAKWVEAGKSKIIFNLSAEEKDYIKKRIEELVNGAINT
jgi:hypothetical protein